jgi:AhpD family alkylhydroperoxidase
MSQLRSSARLGSIETWSKRMTQRLNLYTAAPKALEPLMALEGVIKASSLEPSLIELVKIRGSQINGCANCLHMHTADARAAGEREERIYLLDAWEESSMYTRRERAALAWTESLTKIAETHAPDTDYEALKPHFTEEEIVYLTVLITAINAWNRIAIGFRAEHPNDRKLRKAA